MNIPFELNNYQRKYLGLDLVEDNWEKVNIKDKIWIYFDGDIIKKLIEVDIEQNLYLECKLDEKTENNRQIILPKTNRGKKRKLNYSAVINCSRIGVYFGWYSYVSIANYTTQTNYYHESLKDGQKDFNGLQNWLNAWINDTIQEDLIEIDNFKGKQLKHHKFREGDFFAFKIGRREYGYGRILLDIGKLRKDKTFKKNKNYGLDMFGKPLIIKVYHKKSLSKEIDLDQLSHCLSFPSQAIMDNCFFYGEYEIIGNRTLKESELDFIISYGISSNNLDPNIVYLQYGLIYREKNINEFNKYIIMNGIYNPFRNESIGFYVDNYIKDILDTDCNDKYWEHNKFDLRNPANSSIKHELFNEFGLNADLSYVDNLKK